MSVNFYQNAQHYIPEDSNLCDITYQTNFENWHTVIMFKSSNICSTNKSTFPLANSSALKLTVYVSTHRVHLQQPYAVQNSRKVHIEITAISPIMLILINILCSEIEFSSVQAVRRKFRRWKQYREVHIGYISQNWHATYYYQKNIIIHYSLWCRSNKNDSLH